MYAISDNNPGREEVNWINSSKNVTVDWPFMMSRICPWKITVHVIYFAFLLSFRYENIDKHEHAVY